MGVAVGPTTEGFDELPDGIDHIEIAVGEGEIPVAEFDPSTVADRAADAGLDVIVHLPYRQPLSTPIDRIDDATLAYFDDVLQAAAHAGATTAVAHPSARGAGHRSDRFAARMAALADRGRDYGVTVCFETTGHAGGVGLSRLGELVERADASICLDVGYAYLEAGVDGIEELVSAHGDRVGHLHVHDVRRRGDTHIPVGSGDVPLNEIGDHVVSVAPDATVSVEVFTDDTALLADSVARTERTILNA
ncbi:MAG: sugar phosphate isomerase/epimerase family protein [Halobaculum sp.]